MLLLGKGKIRLCRTNPGCQQGLCVGLAIELVPNRCPITIFRGFSFWSACC